MDKMDSTPLESIQQLQSRYDSMAEEHAKCNATIHKYELELKKIQAELEEISSSKDSELKQSQDQIAEAQIRLMNMEKLSKDESSSKLKLEQDLEEMNKKYTDTLEGLSSEVEIKQRMIMKLEMDKSVLDQENKKITGELNMLEEQLDDILQRNMELQMKLAG
eukprot:NODE_22_length_38364_cov_0.248661.p18 type:complete len:163 gc:universal NODE_22_length_38364_cov_0.248661:30679-31167(+)